MPRLVLAFLGAALLVAACGPAPTSTIPGDPTEPPTLPLPANLTGIPGPADPSAELLPHSQVGQMPAGALMTYVLGHCGLVSPIDIDGSLWDPVGYRISGGGHLTTQHESELINSTPMVAVLASPDTLELRSPSGALIVLQRHDGPRRYFLCD